MADGIFRTRLELDAALPEVKASPRGTGHIAAIVCRPEEDARVSLIEGHLTFAQGLVGDGWSRMEEGSDEPPSLEEQIALINSRACAAMAGSVERWALAGDQLYVDFDLSLEHLPTGTRLEVGTAVLEVTGRPHTGCRKFSARFGKEALIWANGPEGRELRLRGMFARVVREGVVRVGDAIRKLEQVHSGTGIL